jgi:hypothetical protein
MAKRLGGLDERLSRRWLAAGILIPVVLLAIAIPAALSMNDDDESPKAAAPPTTARRLTTSSTVGRPTTTEGSGAATTAAPGTTGAVGGATTAPPPATEPATSTTTTTPPAGPCGPDAFSVRTATDKQTYRRGEEVKITSSVTNTSSAPCAIPSYTFRWHVENEAGANVSQEAATVADFIREPLGPGQRYTTTPTWEPLSCAPSGACTAAPAGGYTVFATWGVSSPPPPASSANFRIEG